MGGGPMRGGLMWGCCVLGVAALIGVLFLSLSVGFAISDRRLGSTAIGFLCVGGAACLFCLCGTAVMCGGIAWQGKNPYRAICDDAVQ